MKKQKLVIDFRKHRDSGIGTYIRNIIKFLINRYDISILVKKNEVIEYEWYKRVKIIDFNSKPYSIKEQFEFIKKIPNCDIFWSPHYNIPILPIKAKKRVVTIHDVFHLAFYDTLNLKQKLYAKYIINQATKKSDIILTVSEFSKNEIIKYTKTKKNINIIYNAIDFDKFKKNNNISFLKEIRLKYNLPDKFILFVGNVKPNKNLKNLFLAILKIDINLVIVGKKDGFIISDNEVSKMIKYDNKISSKVFFTGFVEDKDISTIYSMADIFVFPSLYEGFGIPPLEAQACGCPVVCSNVASLPEVCGNSVLYCNPYDIKDIRDKILMLLNDDDLRKDLIKNGYENIKRFSWQESANKIIRILNKL